MSFIEKYNINKKWAESAYNEQAFDVATNRYYYCIFQKLLLQLDGITIVKEKDEGTHEATARTYVEKVINVKQGKPINIMRERIEFNGNFSKLKGYRHSADYKEAKLTQNDAREMKAAFKVLDRLIP